MTVNQIIDATIGKEGGYSNHPADKGGPTRWGVTEQVARAYGYAGDMRVLPRATAFDIYLKRYWTEPRFADVAAVYPELGPEMFDTGVNMGTSIPGAFLQRALNLLNRGATDYPDIAADGRIGTMTIAALKKFAAVRGAAGGKVLLKTIDGFQLGRYADITEARPANEAFFYGWVANRVGIEA
ncbi:glycoside hydrolase family 108 protein [Sphingomonas sp.]|uniref:glycoside hydrolase family 108 protein n=1 Tax=Sphingomonas sp. TaxID=28214 RepID=UPI0035C822BA